MAPCYGKALQAEDTISPSKTENRVHLRLTIRFLQSNRLNHPKKSERNLKSDPTSSYSRRCFSKCPKTAFDETTVFGLPLEPWVRKYVKNIRVLPYLWFQLPMVSHGPEADDPPSDVSSEGQWQPKATLQSLRHSRGSSHHTDISQHHEKGECSIIRYLERVRPRSCNF